jgi:N-acetylglucosamine-6-phosphate deacetylase
MSSRQQAVAAGHIFDGSEVHKQTAVLIEGQTIVGLASRRDVPAGFALHDLGEEAWLAPGFIDVQVNGGGDVLFNDVPTPEGISAIVAAHRRFGTTGLLPTLISDTFEKMRAAGDAVARAARENAGVLGIHYEGPFLSPEQAGAHDPRYFRIPGEDDVTLLTSLRAGVTLITLAPERVPAGFISRLVRAGVRVSLGHAMATYAETKAALAEGLTGFTHLFNAMPGLEARQPGPVAAALESPAAWFGIIVDGHHVAPPLLRLALRGAAHPMLVTDAMPPVGGTKSSFTLSGHEVTVHEGRALRRDGRLAGSVLDMAGAVRNCVRLLGLPLIHALRFASREPADFLGLGSRLGRLAPGFRADLVAFEPADIGILGTWVAGERV